MSVRFFTEISLELELQELRSYKSWSWKSKGAEVGKKRKKSMAATSPPQAHREKKENKKTKKQKEKELLLRT